MKLKLLSALLCVSHFISIAQCPQGDVVLTNQSEVDNFGDLYPNCQAIEGFLILLGNDIVDLSPLLEINSVGSISITSTSVANMQGLDILTITGLTNEDTFIILDGNPMLQDILFLSNYTSDTPVVFIIRNMSALASLEGAGNIEEFVTLTLKNNDALISLDGLSEDLDLAGGQVQPPFLEISDNAILSNITRLNTAQWTNTLTASIVNNPQLSVCENNLVCSLVENNSIDIQNNAVGCNSNPEVDFACESLAVNFIENISIKIYPNPVSRIIYIDGLDTKNLDYLTLYSSEGQKILETNSSELNLSNMQSGLYFLKIKTHQGSVTKRIIKE